MLVDNGSLELLVSNNDVKEGHQVEVERDGDDSKERMIKFKFSEKKFHQDYKDGVGHQLCHTSQTGHVNVEAVLLFSMLDDLWPQDTC